MSFKRKLALGVMASVFVLPASALYASTNKVVFMNELEEGTSAEQQLSVAWERSAQNVNEVGFYLYNGDDGQNAYQQTASGAFNNIVDNKGEWGLPDQTDYPSLMSKITLPSTTPQRQGWYVDYLVALANDHGIQAPVCRVSVAFAGTDNGNITSSPYNGYQCLATSYQCSTINLVKPEGPLDNAQHHKCFTVEVSKSSSVSEK